MFTYNDYLNNECTFKEYLTTLTIPKLELNKIYIQSKGSWHEKHYKIIFINNDIAVGLCVFNKISQKYIGDYGMFKVSSAFTYNDTRPTYRLSEEFKE